jgi:hypothetical protein
MKLDQFFTSIQDISKNNRQVSYNLGIKTNSIRLLMKKQTYLILLTLIASIGATNASDTLEDYNSIASEVVSTDGETTSDDEVSGKLKGDAIESCQDMIGQSWKKGLKEGAFNSYMYSRVEVAGKKFNKESKRIKNYSDYKDSKIENGKLEEGITKDKLKEIQSAYIKGYSKYRREINSALNNVRRCISLYTVVKSSKTAERQMNYSEDNKVTTSSSFDKKLQCSSVGYETQDYKGCKNAITYYDIIYVGKKVVVAAQQLDYADSKMDIGTEFAKNAQTDATAGLKAQRADIKKKSEMANQRAVAESAGFAGLIAAYQSIPDIDTLHKECTDSLGSYKNRFDEALRIANDAHNELSTSTKLTTIKDLKTSDGESDSALSEEIQKIISKSETGFEGELEGEDINPCEDYIYNSEGEGVHAMINNSAAKSTIEKALADSGVSIATMLGTAAILDKQAGRIGDAIKLVDQHDPETMEYGGEDILTTECQINPNAPACVNSDTSTGVDYYNQGINVDGIQFANSDSTLDDTDEFGNRAAADSSGDTTRDGGGLGFAGINPVDKGGGLVDGPGSAASVKATGTNGLGSGSGGGGGGGGGGGSAPANGSAKTGGDAAKKDFVGSAKKVSFSGGSGGLRFGTSSRKSRKKAKSKNPFANLFKKGGKKKGGVMNFRGVASKVGGKKGSIFKMISNRYTIVNKEKRLIKYEKEDLKGDLPPN